MPLTATQRRTLAAAANRLVDQRRRLDLVVEDRQELTGACMITRKIHELDKPFVGCLLERKPEFLCRLE